MIILAYQELNDVLQTTAYPSAHHLDPVITWWWDPAGLVSACMGGARGGLQWISIPCMDPCPGTRRGRDLLHAVVHCVHPCKAAVQALPPLLVAGALRTPGWPCMWNDVEWCDGSDACEARLGSHGACMRLSPPYSHPPPSQEVDVDGPAEALAMRSSLGLPEDTHLVWELCGIGRVGGALRQSQVLFQATPRP